MHAPASMDGAGWECNIGHCWLLDQIRPVIEAIRQVDLICNAYEGGDKRLSESELAECRWRADPVDGLRPLREIRKKLNEKVD